MRASERHDSWGGHLFRWVAELLLVFIGAYAAFWLSNYQEHREERHRHDQILAALENEMDGAIANATEEKANAARSLAEFRRALDDGEMPRLGTFSFVTDYSATDTATLLESGGYQLLDIKTIIALRKVESVLRGGLSNINHIERLSDELIAPNLDQGTDFFYDPATRKLRRRFAHYPDALASLVKFWDDLIVAEKNLLQQLHAERSRG